MILTLVAELIAGETLLTDGGPVDGVTAVGHDADLWGHWHGAAAQADKDPDSDVARVRVGEPVA